MRFSPSFSRPSGEVLWVHATNIERLLALCDIGQRLKTLRPDLVILATWEAEMGELPQLEGCDCAFGPLPQDQTAEAKDFLRRWRPDLCLWAGGRLRRALLRQMREKSIPALLIDIQEDELPARKLRWLPDQRHRMFTGFDLILTPSPAVRAQLLRSDQAAKKVQLSGTLRLSTTPPGCNHDELADLQQSLGSRPVWLAVRASLEELPSLLEAHRSALRMLHRLMLVIALEDPECKARTRSLLRSRGLQCADWDAGEELNDYTQVLITDSEDLGLWYRLAPISFMASSLHPEMPGQNPLDALALGSVVLHGPGTGLHQPVYSQLAQQNAVEKVETAQALADSVMRLSSPDMAAQMALAGWAAVTEGAEMTDKLIERVQDLLDLREEQNAAP